MQWTDTGENIDIKDQPNCQTNANPSSNCFRDLTKEPLTKYMHEFGSQSVPLSLVGMYLNYAGNHILEYTHSVLKKKIFYPQHRVTSIQILENGEMLTTCQVKKVFIKLVSPENNGDKKYDFNICDEE